MNYFTYRSNTSRSIAHRVDLVLDTYLYGPETPADVHQAERPGEGDTFTYLINPDLPFIP